jgi:hypothetical protein
MYNENTGRWLGLGLGHLWESELRTQNADILHRYLHARRKRTWKMAIFSISMQHVGLCRLRITPKPVIHIKHRR